MYCWGCLFNVLLMFTYIFSLWKLPVTCWSLFNSCLLLMIYVLHGFRGFTKPTPTRKIVVLSNRLMSSFVPSCVLNEMVSGPPILVFPFDINISKSVNPSALIGWKSFSQFKKKFISWNLLYICTYRCLPSKD